MIRTYHLPAWRAVVIGILLFLIALAPLCETMLVDHSITAGFRLALELFTGFPEIILGIIWLVILISGVLYLKNSHTIIRLQLDEQGVHYLPWAEKIPSKYKPLFNLFFLKEPLQFIPYSDILRAEYVADQWLGDYVGLALKDGQQKRLLSGPFSSTDKKEVIVLINSKIHGGI